MAMMNHRALVRAHTHWRPRRRASAPVAAESTRRLRGHAWWATVAALVIAFAVGVGAFGVLRTADPHGSALPAYADGVARCF